MKKKKKTEIKKRDKITKTEITRVKNLELPKSKQAKKKKKVYFILHQFLHSQSVLVILLKTCLNFTLKQRK